MGDHQERGIRFHLQCQHEVQHRVARGFVEIAGGLVGEDQFRACRERPADGDALLLAAGELLGIAPKQA